MFYSIKTVLKEQIEYRKLIFRMSFFEIKGNHQVHYLGTLWQFIYPVIQILIYWLVFGIGLRGGQPIDGVPFILWLLMGLIPWFFISPGLLQGSNSVYQKVNLVSKMNFPVSILPTIKLVSNSFQFIILLTLLTIALIFSGYYPTLYLLQIFYYLLCLYVFLFSFSILSSTFSTLIRDYQMFLQSMMRMLLYLSPILWNPEGDLVPDWLSNILKLNPFYYIINGFRDSFLGRAWFFEDMIYTAYFWILTFVILYAGAHLHLKFRKNFVDYL